MSLLPVEEALRRLLDGASTLPAETVPIAEAAWRVLAGDLHARRTQPPFDVSAMDGYAIRAEDAEAGAVLRVTGTAPAGHRFAGTLAAGEAVRIFTGAPVPPGANSVLIQENARAAADGIEIVEPVEFGRNIRRAGLDFRHGDRLLEAGRLLDGAALSLAAAGNHPALQVVRRPRVAILATGDELVPPGMMPGPDQIIASNAYGVAAIVAEAGGIATDLGIVADDEARLRRVVADALDSDVEILVTLGGASVGDHDLVRGVLTGLGVELDFWKIAMRPGKPLMVGRRGGITVLGLPGNPVASLVCSHKFLKPLLAALSGRPPAANIAEAELATPMAANDQREDYVRAVVSTVEGRRLVTPFGIQDSSMLRVMADANALVIRPPHAPAAAIGDRVAVMMLR